MLLCRRCNSEKLETDFDDGRYRSQARGLRNRPAPRNFRGSWCKACKSEYDKARQTKLKQNPEYVEKEKARKTQDYLDNFPRHWASRQASRAKKAGSSGYVSWEEWQELLKEHDNKCHWCSCGLHASFLTLDHVTPLAQAGTHERSNVVPACANCNHKRKWEDSVKYPELYAGKHNAD